MNRNIITQTLHETNKREIAMSDIHGNFTLYKKLLKKCSYTPNKDRLILCGDLMEKGVENLALLRYVMKQKESEDIHLIMGNCDFVAKNVLFSYRLDFLKSVLLARKNSLIHEMAAEIGLEPLNENTDMDQFCFALRKRFLKELSFLNDLPHVIVTPSRIYTHAGLISEDHFGSDFKEVMTYPFFMNTDQVFTKPVICGHLPVTEYCTKTADFNVRFNAAKNIYDIDGGNMVKKAGQLNALIFEGNYTSSVSCDLLEKKKVIWDAHPLKTIPFFITFNNGTLRVIDQQPSQSYVYSSWLNRTFWIDSMFLTQQKDGSYKGTDFTNYYLPVKKGDIVSVVCEFEDKALVKHNGIMGWVESANLSAI